MWKTVDPLGSLSLEKCESGRIGLTANELTWETGSEGSNPSFSASCCRFGASGIRLGPCLRSDTMAATT